MKKQLKQIKELVKASYKNGQLDKDFVKKVGEHLNRNLLKHYIRLLKQEEKKKMVFITTPKPLAVKEREKVKSLFPKKKIVEQIDPTMISGIKVLQEDEAYELNLDQTFHDIIRFVSND